MLPDIDGQDKTGSSTIVSRLTDKFVEPTPTPETPEDIALNKANEETVMQAVEGHLNIAAARVANESSSSKSSAVSTHNAFAQSLYE